MMKSLAWYRSEERRRLQLQQADTAAALGRALFVVLGLPALALVFCADNVPGWRVVLLAVACGLFAALAVAIVVLGRWHFGEVARIDEEGERRSSGQQ